MAFGFQAPQHEVLYKWPEPSTSFVKEPTLTKLPRTFHSFSELMLSWEVETDDGNLLERLRFINPYVHAVYRLWAVPEFASIAYDKVISFPASDLLLATRRRVASRPTKEVNVADLQHFAVMFDDGPFYEFIAAGFEHDRSPVSK